MQLTSVLCAAILAVSSVQAIAISIPEPQPEAWCGWNRHAIPCDSKRAEVDAVVKREAAATAEAWCGWQKHAIPCDSKRTAEDLYEAAAVAKREAESAPEALAEAWCGWHRHAIPCDSKMIKRAAEAIAEAHASAEANPQPLPSPEAFAEAWCGWQKHAIPCDSKRAAEAVPEAWCGWNDEHAIPCDSKREAILRREYTAALALKEL